MLAKLTGGVFALLLLLAVANYLFNGTGLPGETWELLTIIMDTASLGIGVFLPVAIIFALLAPVAYFLANIGGRE
jgi:hypothetical protein